MWGVVSDLGGWKSRRWLSCSTGLPGSPRWSRGWVMSDEWVYDITMKKIHQVYEGITRWWFQIFFIFTPIWGRFPFWLIFLRWVETTKQIRIYFGLWTPLFSQDAQKNAPNAAGFFFVHSSCGWNPGNPKRLKPEPLPRERREIWEQLKGPKSWIGSARVGCFHSPKFAA